MRFWYRYLVWRLRGYAADNAKVLALADARGVDYE